VGAGVALAGVLAGRRRLSNRARAVLAGAACALLIVGTGLVDVPDPERAIRGLGSTLGPYMYVLVGVMAFLETGAAVGLVAPGELTVILGGVAAGQGEIELLPLIALVWVCAVAGDILSYVLGRRLGRGFLLRHGHRVKLTEERIERVERYFARYGMATIVFGRFVGIVRSLAPFAAGASDMPARRFVPATTVAAGIWAATCSVLGYAFWQSFDDVATIFREGTFGIVLAALLVAGAIALARRLRAQSA
jgi:membrane protein DedA with SNARE-associated domain